MIIFVTINVLSIKSGLHNTILDMRVHIAYSIYIYIYIIIVKYTSNTYSTDHISNGMLKYKFIVYNYNIITNEHNVIIQTLCTYSSCVYFDKYLIGSSQESRQEAESHYEI